MKLSLALLLAAMAVGCRTSKLPPLPSQSAKPITARVPIARVLPSKSVMLAFDAPADTSNIAGYRIYYRNEVGVTNNVDVHLSTTNSVGGLVPGMGYKFWAVSYNAAMESLPSNEVSYTVPAGANTVIIVLWTGPSAQGPWTVALTTNRVQVSATNAFFNQTIAFE